MRTEDFKEFVKTAKKFYDKSRTISQTQNILFSGNTATIVNIPDSISVWLEMEDVLFDNPFTVPFLEFEKIVTKVRDSNISFSVDDEFKVEVTTDKGVFTFLGDKEVNDFPVFLENQSCLGALTMLDGDELMLIKKAEVFASQDESRPAMNNVLIDTNAIVATDAHFLCFYPTDKERESSFLIPKKIAKHICTLKSSVEVLTEGNNHIAFRSDNITILSRQIPDKYPNYRAFIPKDNPIRVSVDTKEFMETLDAASISIPVTKMVTMQVKDGKLSLMAEDIDFGRSFRKELRTGKGEGDITISFNCQKMATILKAEDKESTVFDLSSPEGPMIVNEYCLLMPMISNIRA